MPRPAPFAAPADVSDADAWPPRARAIFMASVAAIPEARRAALHTARRHALARVRAPVPHGFGGGDLGTWVAGGRPAVALALIGALLVPGLTGTLETTVVAESELIEAYHGSALAIEEPDVTQWLAVVSDGPV